MFRTQKSLSGRAISAALGGMKCKRPSNINDGALIKFRVYRAGQRKRTHTTIKDDSVGMHVHLSGQLVKKIKIKMITTLTAPF